MCLNNTEPRRVLRKTTKDLKPEEDKYVILWKVFDVDKKHNLVAQFNEYTFQKGKNTAQDKKIMTYTGLTSDTQYKSGFHCFIHKADANKWKKSSNNDYGRRRVVKAIKVKKAWITTIGYQHSSGLIAVCKHIIVKRSKHVFRTR